MHSTLSAFLCLSAHSTFIVCMQIASCVYSYDEHSHERFAPGDPGKRAFTYFVLTGGRFIYASAIRLAVLKFILSMTVSCLFVLIFMLFFQSI